jgi:peptidoglycan/LPS O-acetylase OafA/YrhL
MNSHNRVHSKRIYTIDLLRFMAALSVLFYHYTFRGFAADDLSIVSFRPLSEISKYGYLGVDFFFMISGFVIAYSTQGSGLKDFIKSRFLRLYPVYWICILITSIVIVLWGCERFSVTVAQILVNFTMFQEVIGISSIDGVYWSLLIELKFYILVGLYLIIKPFSKLKSEYLILTWIALSTAHVFIDFKGVHLLKLINYVFILQYSSYFIAGVLFYIIFRDGIKFKYLVYLGLCLFLSIHYALGRFPFMNEHYSTQYSSAAVISVISTFYFIFYLISAHQFQWLNKPIFLSMGALTYPLYLLHQNIGYIIFNQFGHLINKQILLSMVVLLMISSSYWIHLYCEKPLKAWLQGKVNIILK